MYFLNQPKASLKYHRQHRLVLCLSAPKFSRNKCLGRCIVNTINWCLIVLPAAIFSRTSQRNSFYSIRTKYTTFLSIYPSIKRLHCKELLVIISSENSLFKSAKGSFFQCLPWASGKFDAANAGQDGFFSVLSLSDTHSRSLYFWAWLWDIFICLSSSLLSLFQSLNSSCTTLCNWCSPPIFLKTPNK